MIKWLLIAALAVSSVGCGNKKKSSLSPASLKHAKCKILVEGPPESAKKEMEIVGSQQVMSDVLNKLKLRDRWNQETKKPFSEDQAMAALNDSVKITTIDGTEIIEIKATRPDSLEAAEIANEIARAYLANRLLVKGKASESTLNNLETQIAAQHQEVQAAMAQLKQIERKHLGDEHAPSVDARAAAQLRLEQAESKLRFVHSVPFEEWPYYTNFSWGDTYTEVIKELMNANVTLDHLGKTLGEDHPQVMQTREVANELRELLKPVVAGIIDEARQEHAHAKTAVQNLIKTTAAPALSAEQNVEWATAQQALNEAKAAYQALVIQAEQVGSEPVVGETAAVHVSIIELAKP